MAEYSGIDALFYDSTYGRGGVSGDVKFYVEEAAKAGSPVLELGCGTGRILIPIAQAGVRIVGLDRAPDMLAIARQKLAALDAETQRRAALVEGDMRTFSLDDRFKLILIPFRAFLHLLTGEDQRAALRCIREHLADDGRLIFNVFDPNIEIIAARLRSGGLLQKEMEFPHPQTGHRVIAWLQVEYELEPQLVHVERIFEELDGEGRMASRTFAPFTLRWVYRYEMEYLLELCGYQVEALYGDFGRGPFRAGGEQIWVARKA